VHPLNSPKYRICQYIDENLSSPLKLKTIADIFGYNSAYLGKLFAKETGDHFNVYLDKRRIERQENIWKRAFPQSGLPFWMICCHGQKNSRKAAEGKKQ